jgi:AcrR family transcriptional regulator
MRNTVLRAGTGSSEARRALDRRATRDDEVMRRLVAAGFEVIRETGSLEPGVAEIVRRAGLSNQAFYRHFPSKDALLLSVLEEGFRVLERYLAHRMDGAPTPEARIRAWVGGVLEQALQSGAATATRPFAASRGRLAELFPEAVEASERALRAPLRDAIADAWEAGTLPGADPERDAEAIYTLAMGWLERRLSQGTPAARAEAEHVVTFALAALRRSPGGR